MARRTSHVPRPTPAEEANLLPVYEYGEAPDHLVTRRQLRAAGLAPGGHGTVARLRCKACRAYPNRACTREAGLYDTRIAVPKRTPTLAQEWALDRAMAARQTCPVCTIRFPWCLPTSLGTCPGCADRAADLAKAA